jgi:hypothetical protein
MCCAIQFCSVGVPIKLNISSSFFVNIASQGIAGIVLVSKCHGDYLITNNEHTITLLSESICFAKWRLLGLSFWRRFFGFICRC